MQNYEISNKNRMICSFSLPLIFHDNFEISIPIQKKKYGTISNSVKKLKVIFVKKNI